MPKNEQDQLSHLAEMYSLHMQLNDSPKKGVTLTKTEYDLFLFQSIHYVCKKLI